MKKQEGQLGGMAHYYDMVMTLLTLGREKTLRDKTIELAHLNPGDKVLEIGCGTGTLTLEAKTKVGPTGEVTGIDIAPEMVAVATGKAARKGINVTFREGNIAEIPFPDNSFDTVLCSFMIFHMPDYVRKKGLTEIFRVLKHGGHLFIIDQALPDNKWQRTFVLNHLYWKHDVRELESELKEYFFSEIELGDAKFMGMWYIRGTANKT
jgi:ubiquinone/menaquinone biosynthesis C-methylase UbiE